MIDIRTMLKNSMATQNQIYGASARVHNYYADDSIRKIKSRQMYRGPTTFGPQVRQQAAPAPQQAAPQPVPQKRDLDDFYFYFTYVENGRTYVVFKKSVFLLTLLVISIGVGVLALDVRRLLLFLAKGAQASLASIIS